MWEKFKQSKFASKFKGAGASRAAYVTVVTLLLALAVLITATAISNRVKKNKGVQKDPDQSQQGEQDGTGDQQPSDAPSTGDQTPEDPTGKPEDNPSDEQQTASVPELSLPVSGSVTKGHDTSIQVFSATMGDYRIHLGVDMATVEDAPVMAAADGVISQIWDDPMMGKCLAISHSGDCYTIYKNLDVALPDDIAVGAAVTAGQQIGTVGETATIELAEEPHLHMEMTVGGLAVDPMEYFSAQALAAIGADQSHEAGESETE